MCLRLSHAHAHSPIELVREHICRLFDYHLTACPTVSDVQRLVVLEKNEGESNEREQATQCDGSDGRFGLTLLVSSANHIASECITTSFRRFSQSTEIKTTYIARDVVPYLQWERHNHLHITSRHHKTGRELERVGSYLKLNEVMVSVSIIIYCKSETVKTRVLI